MNIHHKKTAIKQLKDNSEIHTGTVHAGMINKTTTLTLPTEEEWIQDTSKDHDIGYIKRILYIPEETPIVPK